MGDQGGAGSVPSISLRKKQSISGRKEEKDYIIRKNEHGTLSCRALYQLNRQRVDRPKEKRNLEESDPTHAKVKTVHLRMANYRGKKSGEAGKDIRAEI